MVKVDVKYTKLFINNEWVDAVSKKTFPTINPQDETVIAQVAEGDKADIDLAVASAKKAFHRYSEWRIMDASQRGVLMLKLADLIESQARYLAELETLDCGKPVKVAEEEVYYSATVIRYYAGKADKILGNTIPAETDGLWVPSAVKFLKELNPRLVVAAGDNRAGSFLAQRLSITIQRGNAASVLGTIPRGVGLYDN